MCARILARQNKGKFNKKVTSNNTLTVRDIFNLLYVRLSLADKNK